MKQLLQICSSSHLEENDIEINTALWASSEQKGKISFCNRPKAGLQHTPDFLTLCLCNMNWVLQCLWWYWWAHPSGWCKGGAASQGSSNPDPDVWRLVGAQAPQPASRCSTARKAEGRAARAQHVWLSLQQLESTWERLLLQPVLVCHKWIMVCSLS